MIKNLFKGEGLNLKFALSFLYQQDTSIHTPSSSPKGPKPSLGA